MQSSVFTLDWMIPKFSSKILGFGGATNILPIYFDFSLEFGRNSGPTGPPHPTGIPGTSPWIFQGPVISISEIRCD